MVSTRFAASHGGRVVVSGRPSWGAARQSRLAEQAAGGGGPAAPAVAVRSATVTIHASHPFSDPDDPARRLRGRVGGRVTLWTAGGGPDRAGLTVSSVLVAAGEPARVLGLLDPDSDLAVRLLDSRRAVLALLRWRHRDLAEAFAGRLPAPGGAFRLGEFADTPWGPVLGDAAGWAGLELADARPVGWSLLVETIVGRLEVGDDADPLVHRRGRYERPDVERA